MTEIIFRKRAVDTAAMTEGVNFEIIDEIDGSSWGKFKLRYVDPSSASYKLAMRRRLARMTQADKTRLMHPKTEADIEFAAEADIRLFVDNNLLGWEDVLDAKGKPIKYEPEVAVQFFLAERWVFQELEAHAADVSNFRSKSKEEIAKN